MILMAIVYVDGETEYSKIYEGKGKKLKRRRNFCLFFICFVDNLHRKTESC